MCQRLPFLSSDGSVLTVDDTTLLFLQLFHAFGQVLILSASLARGCRVVIQTKFEIDEFLSLVSKYKVSKQRTTSDPRVSATSATP